MPLEHAPDRRPRPHILGHGHEGGQAVSFAHFFDREPGERIRARLATGTGQQLGILDEAARIPRRGDRSSGELARWRFLHGAKIHSSNLASGLARRSSGLDSGGAVRGPPPMAGLGLRHRHPANASRLSAATTAARPISAASIRADSLSALESRRVSPPEASPRAMTDPIMQHGQGGDGLAVGEHHRQVHRDPSTSRAGDAAAMSATTGSSRVMRVMVAVLRSPPVRSG
jgi:hypothetical protein